MKNQNVTIRRTRSLSLPTLSWLTLAVALGLIGKQAGAGTIAENTPRNVALAATVEALSKNSASPQDPAAIHEAAANLLVILQPDLNRGKGRKDSASVKAEAAATATFLNPGALHAKKAQDPAYKRKYEAAMDSFKRQAKKTHRPIRPSAIDAKQIEALRNDPDWRREREDSMRAAMPGGPK
jgi:hypothetical protein